MKRIFTFITFCAVSFQSHAQVSFVLSSSPGVGGSPTCVCPVDVNGDGKIDLVSANTQSGTLTVLTNNGSGGFAIASSPTVEACLILFAQRT
jgi:hypothetical protein